jgi:hypothetical protein
LKTGGRDPSRPHFGDAHAVYGKALAEAEIRFELKAQAQRIGTVPRPL